MRHKSQIISLADCIASQDKAVIQQALRVCSFLPISEDEKKEKRDVLQLAEKFITRHSVLPQEWRNTLACFKMLAEFFIEDETIEAHKEKAICSWYLLFAENTAFTSDFPYEEMILLGKAYIPEPYQLIGFVVWLLEQRVNPRIILNSGLMHHYFNYHSNDLSEKTSVVIDSYVLLRKFLSVTEDFLKIAAETPCLLRGFTNSIMPEDTSYQSYNVMGVLYAHSTPFPAFFSDSLYNKNEVMLFNSTHSLLLVQLFGFEYVSVLLADHSGESHDVLLAILNSEYKHIILDQLPGLALCNVLDYEKTDALLRVVCESCFNASSGGAIIFPERHPLPKNFADLIATHPFYIHVEGRGVLLPFHVIKTVVTQLLALPNSRCVYHLPFLISLAKSIGDSELSSRIITFIADFLIESGNDLPEEYDNVLRTICNKLCVLFSVTLKKYEENIHHAIDLFLKKQTDFFAVENIAGSQLSSTNLIKRLIPYFLLHHYSQRYYQLRHTVLEKYFLLSEEGDEKVDFNKNVTDLLYQMNDDAKTHVRVLQESLCLSENTTYLKNIILYVLTQDDAFIFNVFHKPYGFQCYAFDSIVLENGADFGEWAFSVIPMTDEIMIETIKRAYTKETWLKVYLLESPRLSPAVALEAVQLILEKYKEEKYPIAKGYIELLHPNAYSKPLIQLLFEKAVAEVDDVLIEKLCKVDEKHFPKEIIETHAIALMQKKAWDLVRMLCGLSNKSLNDNIIQKNNISLLIKVLEERKNSALLTEFYMTDIINQSYTLSDGGNTLFHLAAQSGCYDTVVKTFSFFSRYLHPKTMHMFLYAKNTAGKPPQCDVAHPKAERINTFLAEKRTVYEAKYHFEPADGGLWHYTKDRKRARSASPQFWSTSSDSDDDATRKPAPTAKDMEYLLAL